MVFNDLDFLCLVYGYNELRWPNGLKVVKVGYGFYIVNIVSFVNYVKKGRFVKTVKENKSFTESFICLRTIKYFLWDYSAI